MYRVKGRMYGVVCGKCPLLSAGRLDLVILRRTLTEGLGVYSAKRRMYRVMCGECPFSSAGRLNLVVLRCTLTEAEL